MSNAAEKIAPRQEVMASAPTAVSETTAIVSMIERAARDPQVDIDKMERLLQMQERVMARNAEQDFNHAMTVAQSEMRSVAADSNNPQTRSRYASYAALDRAVRPIYTKHGISLSFDTAEGAPESYVRVVCYVSKGGFSRTYHVDMPADGKGAKGGDVMTKTHAVGAGMSYGQRYLLKMIFNMAVGDDVDGNSTDTGEVIGDKQAEQITALLTATKSDLNKFLQWVGAPSISDIPLSKFERAMGVLKQKQATA